MSGPSISLCGVSLSYTEGSLISETLDTNFYNSRESRPWLRKSIICDTIYLHTSTKRGRFYSFTDLLTLSYLHGETFNRIFTYYKNEKPFGSSRVSAPRHEPE